MIVLMAAVLLPLIGCSPLESQARDTAAALLGSIVGAQGKYMASCTANSGQEILSADQPRNFRPECFDHGGGSLLRMDADAGAAVSAGDLRAGKVGASRTGGGDIAKCSYFDTSNQGGNLMGAATLISLVPNQAADKQYVDSSASVKADLLNGLVPTGELGTGTATANTCLNGNSTWGSCGGGAPAGITYATTALNWSQTITTALTGGSPATVTLTPCPAGIDTTSGAGYQVLLSGGGTARR